MNHADASQPPEEAQKDQQGGFQPIDDPTSVGLLRVQQLPSESPFTQDFNTWQQIARSKMDISYNEADSQCKLVLSFDDPEVPTFNVLGLGKTKKESKKNAL